MECNLGLWQVTIWKILHNFTALINSHSHTPRGEKKEQKFQLPNPFAKKMEILQVDPSTFFWTFPLSLAIHIYRTFLGLSLSSVASFYVLSRYSLWFLSLCSFCSAVKSDNYYKLWCGIVCHQAPQELDPFIIPFCTHYHPLLYRSECPVCIKL